MTSQGLRFALLGHPIAHSLSPAIHERAYQELGLPHRYDLRDVPDEAALREALEFLRDGYYAGLNVTVPWKRRALELSDRVDALAGDVGAANVLKRNPDGRLTAYNTDALALREELGAHPGDEGHAAAAVIGNGGAALAAVAAARALGITDIAVTARRFEASVPAESWSHAGQFTRLGARVLAWPDGAAAADWQEHCARCRFVIQATSAGMHGAETGESVSTIVPWASLGPATLAYDVVYNPGVTPFLTAARQAGVAASGGLGMLVGQAAHALQIWLECEAPRAAMLEAAERALAERAQA